MESDYVHEMNMEGHKMAAQVNVQTGIDNRFRIRPADRTQVHVPSRFATGVADRSGLQTARSQGMEHAVEEASVQLSLMGAVGISEQCQRPVLRNDRLPSRGNLVKRVVP